MIGTRSTEGVIASAKSLTPENLALLKHWSQLDVLYAMYGQAQREIERITGVPICRSGCALCCKESSVFSLGIEAEYAASMLLGQSALLKPALERIREWLTKPGKYTYGKSITGEVLGEKWGELVSIAREPCCLLNDDSTCSIHFARPAVCRAYGVTRMPDQWCPRPLGNGEDANSRAWWNPTYPSIPIKPRYMAFRKSLKDYRYRREGFFVSMIFERFCAEELAGMLDDGKVPMLKVACGIGKEIALLWQDQMESAWSNRAADKSIKEQVPLVERAGNLIMQLGVK